MRWSEMAHKECVDVVNGERLGNFSNADLRFDPKSGRIEAIHIPMARSWFSRRSQEIELQWRVVKTVGSEMILIDSQGQSFSHS